MKSQVTSTRRITPADHFNIRLSFTELFHSYNDFSARVSFFEIPHRLCGLAQLVSPVDNGCHLSRLHQIAHQLQILFVQLRSIVDELLAGESRQQIRSETPNYTPPRFRM